MTAERQHDRQVNQALGWRQTGPFLFHVLDPAEQSLPFGGRTRFEGMENEGAALIGRVEGIRDAYHTTLEEHRQGRAFARHMAGALEGARAGDRDAQATLRNAAAGYVNLIRGHIHKEDHILFEMADQMVRGPACRALCGAYGGVCARHHF